MHEISIDGLTPDTVAKKTLVASDGSILIPQGEKFLSVHIDLMREVPERLKPRTIAIVSQNGKVSETIEA